MRPWMPGTASCVVKVPPPCKPAWNNASIDAVRHAYDTWRAEEDAAVGTAFEHLCDRFWHQIQRTVDELLRYSAELFAIPFTAIGAGSLWRNRSGFYYKFWQEPPGLMLLTNGFVRLLPGILGHPIILRQSRQRAAELADMQSGRAAARFRGTHQKEHPRLPP